MKCPVDHSELRSRTYEAGIAVDACPACEGMFLDRGELEAIQESHEHDYTQELTRMPDLGYNAYELAMQKSGRVLRCPKCDVEMESREYARCSQVLIDVCPRCRGVWLDRGEIQALELFFERSHLPADQLRKAYYKGFTEGL